MKRNKTILQAAIVLAVILIGAGSVLSEPKKKGKKQELTNQQIKNTLDQIEKHKPELAEQLRDIRKDDPELFRKKITYMHDQWIRKKQIGQKNQVARKRQAGQKKNKMTKKGKGPRAFGNKGQSPEQCDAGMMNRRGGRRGMGMRKGRGQKGMARKMRNRDPRQGRRSMMQDRRRQGRDLRMDNRRPNLQQRGRGRSQVCQHCGAGLRSEMMGQRRRQRGMGPGIGRGMGPVGNKGPRRFRNRQW